MKIAHIGLQGLGLFARKGLIALSFLIVARTAGPKIFGQYTYVFTLVYLFFVLSSLGFTPVSTREIARAPAEAGGVLAATLTARLLAALIAVALLFLIELVPSPLQRTGIMGSVLIFALIIPPYALLDQFGGYVMGFGQNGSFAMINAIQWGSFALATVAAILRGVAFKALLTWQVAGMWLGFGLVCFLLREHLKDASRAGVSRQLTWHLFKESIPLAVTGVLGILYFRIGTLCLFQYAGARETGVYTSALQVVEALQLAPMAIVGAAFPAMSRDASSPAKLSNLFERVNSSLLFTALFIGTTGSVLSATIVHFIFGADFSSSGTMLRLLIWVSVPNFLSYSLGYFLISLNRQIRVTLNVLVGVIVSVVLNLVLIPRYGALGAVYSSVITEFTICFLHLTSALKYISIRGQGRLISLAVGGGLLVWLCGTSIEHQINDHVLHALGFAVASFVLFFIGFLLYRRLGSESEPTVVEIGTAR